MVLACPTEVLCDSVWLKFVLCARLEAQLSASLWPMAMPCVSASPTVLDWLWVWAELSVWLCPQP